MDSDKARLLLEKYWNCESSLEEEKELRNYFLRKDIPEDLMRYQSMFKYFHVKRESQLPEDFDSLVIDKISNGKNKSKQRFLGHFYKVAAAVILIFSVFMIHQRYLQVKEQARQVVEDTFEDPQKALEETKKMLYFVSDKLNMGKEQASRISKFKKAEEVVKNTNYKDI